MNSSFSNKLIQLFLGFLFLFLTAFQVFAQATSDQYLTAANQFYQSRDYAKASTYYKAAIQTNPNSAAAYQGLGNCQYALGQKQDALASYDKALSLNPNNPGLVSFDQNLRAQIGNQPALPPTSSGLAEDVLNPNASASSPIQATPAPNDPNSPRENNYWTAGHSHDRNVADFNFGLAFYNSQTGFGGGSTYYFPISKTFSIGVGSNVYVFSSPSTGPYGLYGSTAYFAEVLLTCRYMLEGKTVRPYFFGGGGLDVVLTTNTGGYSSDFSYGFDPMLVGGAGISIPLSDYICFFAQAKASFVFAGSTTNTAINPYGYNTSSSTSGTLSYEPIELGFTLPI